MVRVQRVEAKIEVFPNSSRFINAAPKCLNTIPLSPLN